MYAVGDNPDGRVRLPAPLFSLLWRPFGIAVGATLIAHKHLIMFGASFLVCLANVFLRDEPAFPFAGFGTRVAISSWKGKTFRISYLGPTLRVFARTTGLLLEVGNAVLSA